MSPEELSNEDFAWVTTWFEGRTGIRIGPEKASMVISRLLPRLRARGAPSLTAYVQTLRLPSEEPERVLVVDQLTTHETYFFREPKHFAVLDKFARDARPNGLRVWSAACSTGEEAATIALVLEEVGLPYQVVGTDIGADVVRKAQRCVFPIERSAGVDPLMLQRHCLRGIDESAGTFCLKDSVAQKLQFRVANLLEPIADLGRFDVIFLRNVLIYFDDERRKRIVRNVLQHLKPGGLLLPGHTETVRDCSDALKALGPAWYRYEPSSRSAS